MIEVRNLTRRYGAFTAVEDLSFTVATGEVLGFLGPNGAGKTTTMRILTGSLGATSGDVTVAGEDVRKRARQARGKLGYLPEQPPLYLQMTVRAYVDHAARLRGVGGKGRSAAVERALGRVGLNDVAGRVIEHLSKGYRQRVGLAQALVHDPAVLILDEPTSGLDPAQMAEIRTLIAELRGEHTVVLSTHILSEVTASCDRVLILSRGRLVALGTEGELRQRLGADRRVRLRLARAGGGTAEALGTLPGVAEVQDQGEGWFAVTLDRPETREALNHAAVQWGLLESRSQGGLEELYLKAVAGELDGLAPASAGLGAGPSGAEPSAAPPDDEPAGDGYDDSHPEPEQA
jgi:ABC-2 type transport system ATP-binding protein